MFYILLLKDEEKLNNKNVMWNTGSVVFRSLNNYSLLETVLKI
jgi:hypothetical protein